MAVQGSVQSPPGDLAGMPSWVAAVLRWRGLPLAVRAAMVSPFLISGVAKLLDFGGAMGEVAGLGLRPPGLMAALLVATQLIGSALFLIPRSAWLGAGLLAGFTVVATLIAHPFWAFEGAERAHQGATFFEHVAIVGGFAAAAALTHLRDRLR